MSRKPAPRKQSKAGRPAATPVALPFAPRTARRVILGSLGVLGMAALGTWAVAARVPEKALMAAATTGSEAGFVVRQVEITGAVNQPRLSIYREVLQGGSDSMLLTDLPAMRERLKALPWVKEVSIARRWPDRLEIRVAERKPAALWQQHGRIRLIDAEGVPLPAEDLAQFPNLPMLVGAGAQAEVAGLLRLTTAHPELAREMEAALWVGQRRWDMRMKSGETISLPEGPAAEAALMRFAEIHRETPMFGRGFVRFDLRIPDKMVVRVGGEPGTVAKPRPEPKAPAGNAPAHNATVQPNRAQPPVQTAAAEQLTKVVI
ncbi:FtsQ-type POTRA domain-containing protein [Sandaracinobacter sp. RS1-74]|uniref:cell division protein FtsQ/DivIB n=1 Tax=Sandaracinobacteroides sayramensis TaxID=2913411 RepID=UPI001EDAE148|nr:cell division protein FtsQ/DivIB [Sandaracinobacteroides sayramensis]MCG2840471.1 FtsQ-type POTRA domain-containing protein [Sandaracinobacteroides sayramensis]